MYNQCEGYGDRALDTVYNQCEGYGDRALVLCITNVIGMVTEH